MSSSNAPGSALTQMTGADWEAALRDDLEGLRSSHLLRQVRAMRRLDATHVELQGRRYVNFSSNNYLGLTHHPRVIEAAREALAADGAGSGAAGLITGYGPAHEAAERRIAAWKGTESALLLPSGYQANHAAIQTLAAIGERRGGVRFLLDKLAHASLVDAVRATGAPLRVFPHNHLAKLGRLLADRPDAGFDVVVTESVFSMDGDTADLAGLAEMKRKHPFILLLDEAHASGVYGPRGAGFAAECALQESVDVSVLTLSKALGSMGGVVCARQLFRDAMLNFGRAYIYSTSIAPVLAAAAVAAIDALEREPQHQHRLREISRRVRSRLIAIGCELPGVDSPILAIVLGSEENTLNAAEELRQAGLLILAVRPPTVPRGSSRLRVTLSAAHTDDELDLLVDSIGKLTRR